MIGTSSILITFVDPSNLCVILGSSPPPFYNLLTRDLAVIFSIVKMTTAVMDPPIKMDKANMTLPILIGSPLYK